MDYIFLNKLNQIEIGSIISIIYHPIVAFRFDIGDE